MQTSYNTNERQRQTKQTRQTNRKAKPSRERTRRKKRRQLAELDEEIKQMKRTPYRRVIGALSHLTRMTRPEIQFATFYHTRTKGRKHWISKTNTPISSGTKESTNRNSPLLEVYSDSDYLGDPDEARSTTGIVIKVYGIPVLVKSRIQTLNAKSSTAAEIIAMCDATEEAIWIKNLLTEMGETPELTLYADNKPSISTVENAKISKGNKHIANKYYFVKGYVKEQTAINQIYVPTKENSRHLYESIATTSI